MSTGVLTLLIINFLYISALPLVFFKRDGKFNPMWWTTATPFIVCPLLMLASLYGVIPRLSGYGTQLSLILELVAVPISVVSISLISFTLGTHRIPIALWHQQNDAPQHIVTYGAYGRIRHPFYASFLLAFLAAVIYCPQVGTIALLFYGIFILNFTAAREEKKLSESEFGEEYKAYIQRTGRFIPRFGQRSA
jgi:protein-S-isoprenylcysteine O-methyltransferase Ste14